LGSRRSSNSHSHRSRGNLGLRGEASQLSAYGDSGTSRDDDTQLAPLGQIQDVPAVRNPRKAKAGLGAVATLEFPKVVAGQAVSGFFGFHSCLWFGGEEVLPSCF
jgi:hypothetical protein